MEAGYAIGARERDRRAICGGEVAADVITAARVVRQVMEGKRMSKLAEAAERIAQKKATHDAKGDEWLARLDALDQREPDAFAMGDAALSEREVDLSDMEKTVRVLSNLPNGSGQ
jgi:hypothetical protein